MLFYIPSDAHLRRMPPATPNKAMINSVSVSEVSATEYDVTLNPLDCGHEFPLFGLANAQVGRKWACLNCGHTL